MTDRVPVSSTVALPFRSRTCGSQAAVRARLGPARRSAHGAAWSAVLLAVTLVVTGALPARAQITGIYYVNGAAANCSNLGAGTPLDPYCSISAALAAHHDPGTTIRVMPGTYREQVTVPASGAAGRPIVIEAAPTPGGSVVVDGADDFAHDALWTKSTGGAWLASSVTWSPVQVFADGVRLTPYTGSPKTLPTRSFVFVAGSGLYVDVGGGSPAAHGVAVGRRAYGFQLSNRAWITVRGFHVTRAENRGIQLTGATNTELLENDVTLSGRFGIQANGCAALRIASNRVSDAADHGIALIGGSTGCVLEDNESFRNARPLARAANGIYLFGAPRNVIRRNRLHDNQDTGLQIQTGSDDNLSVQNLSWANGDHGFDHLHAHRNVHIGDVAFGNYKDGFSIEGNSTGQQLANCVAVDNGLATAEFDLWVDDSSSTGFVSDDNIFWNSSAQAPVKYRFTRYATVAEYSAASGQDARTFQLDPMFVNAAAGDFHLRAGSPAIDDANSALPDWPATDADGSARVDDPATPNRGLGPVPYADRGAFEYLGRLLARMPRRSGPASLTGDGGARAGAVETGTTAAGRVADGPTPADGAVPGSVAEAPAPGQGPVRITSHAVTPNPVRDQAHLVFATTSPTPVTVRVFDLNGRMVRSLAEATPFPAGVHRLALDARGVDGGPLPDGVYFYQLVTAADRAAGRFAVAR